MTCNYRLVLLKQLRHLSLCQPHSLILQPDINLCLSIWSLIDNNLLIFLHTFLFPSAKILLFIEVVCKRPKLLIYQRVFLLDYFYIDFRLEFPYIDEISNGKQRVLKKVMKLADKMQVFCQLIIKPLIPKSCGTIHDIEQSLLYILLLASIS